MNSKLLAIISLCLATFSASANIVQIATSPSAWRLENYVGGVAVVWFTGSPCSGQLSFAASALPADLNRFWATVSTAKATGKRMFVFYENANAPSTCTITSFGLDSE